MCSQRVLVPRHLLDDINRETEKGMKLILAHDLNPNSVPFMLAKTNMMEAVGRKFNVDFNLKFERIFLKKGWRMMLLGYILHKTHLFRNLTVIKSFDRLTKIHRKFKKNWYHTMDGLKIFMNESDSSMKAILDDYIAVTDDPKMVVWEPETTKLVKQHVKAGDTCLDVGASIGYFTMQFSRLVGTTGRVLAFEPTTNQIPYLKENIRKNGFGTIAKVFNMGAWDKTQEVELPLNAPIKYKSKCYAIDDILETEGITNVDFIKI